MPRPVSQLTLNRLSDNVGRVKSFLSVHRRALERERHFALAESAVPTKARSVIVQVRISRSDPCISSIQTSILITTTDSSHKRGAGRPINYSMFD
jgi:hypothetical protein